MNDFLTTLLQAVIVAAVPVCAAFIGQAVKALAAYLGRKSDSDMARKYLEAAASAISTAVTYTSQTYVDGLKKAGAFTPENQREALEIALGQAQSLLTKEAKAFLKEAYGDLEAYLKSRIEAEVRNQKTALPVLA
ncbi:hypothetical protein D7X94_08725 [Acutalibacter sp. 1XD8-33]|uniref:hypothetical protein n=1 Tax=Acutalibacter sp. 1XD8-33 TaxID=2320081 RepID=UPI000EA158DB|nr:hypothetical protein [Acutalibacter sp. 1XD8-33]RKJ40220.1 hypothetical protein D7X94_08725 [Acutalibacter sp. 1XD8-33]